MRDDFRDAKSQRTKRKREPMPRVARATAAAPINTPAPDVQDWQPMSNEEIAHHLGEEAYKDAIEWGLPAERAQRWKEIWGSPLEPVIEYFPERR